jgi:TetR/AcrR family transcriptional repressor of nem operon
MSASILKYDHTEALNKATKLFWQKGYQGTKMRDLQEHLDMRPGSIYAGFGSKEAMFLQVLDCYVAQSLSKIDEYNRLTTHPLEALKSFVSGFIFVEGKLENCKVCLLVKTVSESETSQPKLHTHALLGLQKIQLKFTELFTQAQQLKLLSQSANTEQLGKWLQMQIMGLVIYSKNCAEQQDITLMIEHIFSSLRQPS